MPVTVKLKYPIKTHKSPECREIELRDLTADDMIEVGVSPVTFVNLATNKPTADLNKKSDTKVVIDYKIAFEYLVRLSGLDAIILGTLRGPDFTACANAVMAMWNEAEGE